MAIHYAANVKNALRAEAPYGITVRKWHQSAIGDTHTSHTLPGRLYVVQCEWCPEAFAAHTKAEAMAMFRVHEAEMTELDAADAL